MGHLLFLEECYMTWTHCVSEIPIRDWFGNRRFRDGVSVDGSVYLFGSDDASEENGLQILSFHPQKHLWNVIQPLSPNEVSTNDGLAPKGEDTYFVVSHNQKVYVCVGDQRINAGEIYIFDTRSFRWSCVATSGDVPSGSMRVCTSEHNGHIYMCADCDINDYLSDGSYIWSLELHTMRWKIVATGGWTRKYSPRCVVPYENRLYVLLQRIGDFTTRTHDDVTYFDLTTKKWVWLEPPGLKPIANQDWIPFVHRHHLYVLLCESWWGDYDIVTKNEVVTRYSFIKNEWEQVWFKGISPTDVLNSLCVVDNIVIFFSCYKKKAYVLNFFPTLRSLCLQAVSRYKLDSTLLPEILKRELVMYSY
ncbi:hypothetical protein R5R35_009656 [Gryllus longicercus]|uniref:Uncharacterized protein n=1 Tax=Gryllus longicercus TaxID=2509291 RepID=A0AAN9V9E9_9ORTH